MVIFVEDAHQDLLDEDRQRYGEESLKFKTRIMMKNPTLEIDGVSKEEEHVQNKKKG